MPQTLGIVETDAERERTVRLRFKRAEPIRALHVDGAHAQAVTLRILDQHGGRVKAHRLIVEHGAGEGCKVMHLEVGRCIGDERKACRMRLREAIHCKRCNALYDVVLRSGAMPLPVMPERKRPSKIFHALHGAAHPHGAAQLFGLGSGKAGNHHCHAQKLLLKERHTQCALQDRL